MEWPDEFSLKLIQAYRKKRLLWDVTHKSHYKKNLKADAWKEISEEMNVSVILCQKKMLSLQSSYRRERKKVSSFKAAGKQGFESSWFGYEAFKFLEDNDLPQKEYTLETDKIIKIEDDIEAEVIPLYEMEQETIQTEQQIERHPMSQCLMPLPQPEQDTERRPMSQDSMPLWQLEQLTERRSMPQCLMPLRIPEQETERCHMPQCLMPLRLPEQKTKCRPMEQPMPIISTVSSISRSTKRHREKGDCINSSKMTNAFTVLESAPKSVERDPSEPNEIDAFFTYVVAKVHKYSPEAQKRVQHAVFDILMQADRGMLDYPTSAAYSQLSLLHPHQIMPHPVTTSQSQPSFLTHSTEEYSAASMSSENFKKFV